MFSTWLIFMSHWMDGSYIQAELQQASPASDRQACLLPAASWPRVLRAGARAREKVQGQIQGR